MTATSSLPKVNALTSNPLYQGDFITTRQIKAETVELIIKTAACIKQDPHAFKIENKIIASCFFEPSTRTRLSFESAALKLGGKVIGFSNTEGLSIQKGETLSDTVRMLDAYADLIVIRHPSEGSARLTAEIANCPVINAGDGANQHPTQAMLDIFTIHECQKSLQGLSIALVGDLKHGRTIHSLVDVCSLFDMRLYLVAPEALSLPDHICDSLKQRGLRFSFHQSLDEIIPKIDVLYMTRIQKERFAGKNIVISGSPYTLTTATLRKARENLKILHPLPRVDEIPTEIDTTPYACYFQQAANGVPVRQAILSLLLNEALT